jgi:hypothetical protein
LALSRAGYAIKRSGMSPQLLPPPCQVPGFNPVDQRLLQTVREREWALIRYAPQSVNPARLVAEVALGWPDLTVAVVVRRLDEGRRFAACLRQYGLDVARVGGRHRGSGRGRVAVTTPQGLADLPTDVAWLDVVFTLDAVEATAKVYTECLVRACRARLYGLLPCDVRPAPLEADLLAALFGFEEVVLPRHGCHERRVEVLTVPCAGGMPLPAGLDGLRLKRQGLWRHERRNRLVAQLARAVCAKDVERLQASLPAVAAALARTPGNRVAVLVENVEHALALTPLLAGWPVVTGRQVQEQGLPGKAREQLRARQSPWRSPAGGLIVTAAGLAGIDPGSFDVVVRADGGRGLPALRPEQLVQPDDQDSPLWLIDLKDRHHPVLRQWARSRVEAYSQRSWFAAGVEVRQGRVERYLACRKGGSRE